MQMVSTLGNLFSQIPLFAHCMRFIKDFDIENFF